MMKKTICLLLSLTLLASVFAGCGSQAESASSAPVSAAEQEAGAGSSGEEASVAEEAPDEEAAPAAEEAPDEAPASAEEEIPAEETEEVDHGEILQDRAYIEETLNLKNNADQTWTYSADSDAWTLSVVSAVAYPEIPEEEGVSVCVPGAYVVGIDTDGDGSEDLTAAEATDAVCGSLVIDYEAQVTSSNGQVYTASTAPIILNTGAAGYSSSTNSTAAATYAAEGYINVACGNRGKQDSIELEDGSISYTGDAPSCLCDQKAAARYVKYNVLLGNLPGNVDYLVSTGGSGGGAHATMFAATSNNPDFYDYQIAVGAVGVYQYEDGTYTSDVMIDDTACALSDGAWGCIAYSAITSLAEADMAMALEYYMDSDYDFNTDFQKQMAAYLAEAYMDYINGQNLTVDEAQVGFDLDGDGAIGGVVPLTIERDEDAYPETGGYYGSYLNLYLSEFHEGLAWYLENLDYAEGWTWFNGDGSAMSDDEVAAMTTADKAEAFLEGRYTAASAGMSGGPDGGMGGPPDGGLGDLPDGGLGTPPDGGPGGAVGTPDAGTTQGTGSGVDSSNYASYDEMVAAYQADIDEVQAGDEYGKNIVELYNPRNYIGAEGTENPSWVRIMMGAAEGDISMFNSLNLEIDLLNAGVDAEIEWQWDGGHVPSEIFGESFALYVDEMYGEYVDGAVQGIEKAPAEQQTANGDSEAAEGTDLSSWVSYDAESGSVDFSLADAAAYRVAGASKAIPGFDVMDYGQEDYVFGSHEADARHWDSNVLGILVAHADVLEPLFNQG